MTTPGAMRAMVCCATLAACGAAAAGRARPSSDHAHEISRQVVLMGTRATLTTWDTERARGIARLERLLRPIEAAEAALSTWRSDSEIRRLNDTAGDGSRVLTPATCRLFARLDRWFRETEGAFDPSIGPIVEAWDLRGSGRVPPPATLYRARARSGWTKMRFDAAHCTIGMRRGAVLDVGGFGKGEALDRVRAAAPDSAPWLIDLGGQVAVAGAPPDASAWTIAIAHPHDRLQPMTHVVLTRGSLSTSAGSERDRNVNGVRVGHILDPRTGRPAPFDGAVTVWAEEALTADVLSTALYVLGPARGLPWADAHHVAALFATTDRHGRLTLRRSAAWTFTEKH